MSEASSDSIASPIDNESPSVPEANEDTLELEDAQEPLMNLSVLQRTNSLTWARFLSAIGMKLKKDNNRKIIQNVKLARIAIDRAVELGCVDWEYITLKRRFVRI